MSIFAIRRRAIPAVLLALTLCLCAWSKVYGAAKPPRRARIFVLMVWDGLRPDLVARKWTPNLFRMEHEGVLFAHQHAVYPPLTMVNGAAMATGAYPGDTSILGDSMYLAPRLAAMKIASAVGGPGEAAPLGLERSALLARLNGPEVFNGKLLGFETVAQQIRRIGGFVAIVGKRGPTFLFDDSVTGDRSGGLPIANRNFMFVTDDLVEPSSLKSKVGDVPPVSLSATVPAVTTDAYFTEVVAKQALSRAKTAALAGHPALIVLWQHNPDLVQHRRGLGTQADLDALKACDANLAKVRKAIAALKIRDRTDLMVVSDHGFATIRSRVPLAKLLVAAGLKQSYTSRDVTVVANGGSDLIWLSEKAFPTLQDRRAILQKIVDFAEAQPWVGPLFTRSVLDVSSHAGYGFRRSLNDVNPDQQSPDNLGWIKGTFSLKIARLIAADNYADAPDLVISFRELPDAENSGFTGPGNPAYVFGAHGEERAAANHSSALVVPVKGLLYADARGPGYTTGMGMHGAVGARELHNFCAAFGPDFRRHFVDEYPSGNIDVRATIASVLDLPPGYKDKGGSRMTYAGRSLDEARAGHQPDGSTNEAALTVSRKLAKTKTTTTLHFVEFVPASPGGARGAEVYLDDAQVKQTPLPASKKP